MEQLTKNQAVATSQEAVQNQNEPQLRDENAHNDKSVHGVLNPTYQAGLRRDAVQPDIEAERKKRDEIEAWKSYCSRRCGGANCDDKSAQIYDSFDKNDWRIQPAEFYRFHDAEVNTFGYFFFSSRRRHTRSLRDWSSDVCSSDLTLTLYQAEWCPFSSAVREVLTELGLDFVARQVEPWPKDRAELKAIAQTDQIPVLQVEDGRLFRGARAIFAHLREREPSKYAAAHRRRFVAHRDARESNVTAQLLEYFDGTDELAAAEGTVADAEVADVPEAR